MAELTECFSNKCFDGIQKVYSHMSSEVKCTMKFAVYFPPQCNNGKCPVLFYLSGLTCTEQNFIGKAGAQQSAAKHGIAIVAPDTSPRFCGIEGEDDSWDFGSGAGFYVDATEPKWSQHYRMFSYVTRELPELLARSFPDKLDVNKLSITGHSMGGHGALICGLKMPGYYRSVSAFAPICNPINCTWGQKALTGYLGADQTSWTAWDACELVAKYNGPDLHLLIDQGAGDEFLEKKQLLPGNLVQACAAKGMMVNLRSHEGYDHSYYFISTFIAEHVAHHATYLNKD